MIHGLDVRLVNVPPLDAEFIPLWQFNRAFTDSVINNSEKVPVTIAVERSAGQVHVHKTFIHGTEKMRPADRFFLNRLVKTILWMRGGYKVYVSGSIEAYEWLKEDFSPNGCQAFDSNYFENVYSAPFEVVYTDTVPNENEGSALSIGGHLDGCRIGFDAGASDRKVSAVIDGTCVYDEEVVWFPKLNADPKYHYDNIVEAFKTAASHMPRVDAVGISSAGIYIDNKTVSASLFLKVPKQAFDETVRTIYETAVRNCFGDVPFSVVNDGDVSALAGSMSLGKSNVLGISMGTSEAAGFVNADGKITGWLNELAFVPVDAFFGAMRDEWSGDFGCGVKYFSQDAVIKLAPRAGIKLPSEISLAEKLKFVQRLMERGDEKTGLIYKTIGSYLGHTLPYYYDLYGCTSVLLLGRVMSGRGGDLILEEAERVLADEYPQYAEKMTLTLPNEKFRRLGQSAAAASLPERRK